jgi:PAS domain S-box-containing protein
MVENGKSRLEVNTLLEDFPFLRQLMHNIDQVVWVMDLSTDRMAYISPAFATVWGLPRESLYDDPTTLINSIHPEDRVIVMSASLDTKQALDQSYRITRPDGSLRWISAHTFLVQDETSGTFYEVCVAQDVTDQHQVDHTLRRALDRSREQFTLSRRMSLARKPEAVLKTLMSASELRSAQRAYVLFFDSPPGEPSHEIEEIASWLPGLSLSSASPIEPSNETSLFEDLALLELFHPSRPVIVTDISKDQRLTPAVRDLLADGHTQALAIFPLVALGNWLGCLLVLFTHEKQFETLEIQHIKVLVDQAAITFYNLRLLDIEAESRHEAERANEIKTKFLAMISHELRTPLTSIKGFITTLLAEDVVWAPEEQRDFYQTIHQEANRLQELIDHLLDLSRLEAGMLPIALKPQPLHDIIEDALPQFHSLTNRHVLNVQLPANLPQVYVDARRIAQVLVNLVRNASTYSPEETEISISASVRKGFVQVNVTDQGPGIPPAERKRVFQAFRRGAREEDGASKGAGLGLAISKGLVEAHGGRIWIKKKTSAGTTISFTIPLVPSSLPEFSPEEGKKVDG